MDAERWKHVDSLLEAALARPPDERDAFLRQTCVDDDALEREIRSLLAAREQAGSFLESRNRRGGTIASPRPDRQRARAR